MKHKIIRAIAIFFIIGFSFNSCKKDIKIINKSNYLDLSGCKVSRFYDEDGGQRYFYDSSGRISKVEHFGQNNIDNTVIFSYESGKAYFSNPTGGEKAEYFLDSASKAIKSSLKHYGWPDTSQIVSTEITFYKYNSDGNLIEKKIDFKWEGDTIIDSKTYTYLWNNGNMIKETFRNNIGTSIKNYDYYLDKSNPWIATLSDLQFTGVQSKNLLKTIIYDETGFVFARYTYQFSTDGKPIKIIYDFDDGNYSAMNLEITCP
ncbi:MAG: hypothetical protein ACOVO9_06260 [Bacteroidia bacterium]